jgi:hypothetical protein
VAGQFDRQISHSEQLLSRREKEQEVESRNRNVWIIVVAALALACCCMIVIGSAVVAGLAQWRYKSGISTSLQRERIEQTFDAGDTSSLKIDSFAGNVTVRAGERGTIRVVATKKASRFRDLTQITVDIHEQDGGLVIKTSRPMGLDRTTVDLEITTPPATRLDLNLGAGQVNVRGLARPVKAHNGAGSVDIADVMAEIEVGTGAGAIVVRGAVGPVRLNNGAGAIVYQGTPQGDCRFNTGAGSIVLTLPANPDVAVDLSTGVGTIRLECPVDGRVTKREVTGLIGSGDEGSIYADSGVGGIGLTCR